ncbi:MAG: ankyrin repeat domain-containing protein, partial [Endozoicomonadaceae bacterium]|nr:ankyrin repeat domain-containing protein [Endozoicomonadaceae bacterium]
KDKDWDDKALSLIALKEIFEKPSHKTFTLGDSNFDLSDNMMKCAILGMKHTPIDDASVKKLTDSLADVLQDTDTAVPGNSGENLAPALPDADNLDLEKQVAPIPQIKTPLMNAAEEGDFHIVQQLYENGADVNQKDESGDTPFMFAYKNDHKQIENFLLEKMASTNKSAEFLLAIRNGNMDLNATKTLFNYLLKDKDWDDKALSLIALKEICEKPSHKTFTLGASNFDLLDNMAKCAMLRMKYTMLDEAFVKKLTTDSLANVLQGTNTAVPGNSGENLAPALPDADNLDLEKQVAPIPQIKTPLMNAAEEGDFHIVQQLYENGADVNQKDESGDTPFMFAYKNDHKQIENFLLEKMASTNKSAEFLLAIRNGNMDLNATKTLFNYLLKDKDWDDKALSLIALKEIFEKPSHKTFTLGDSNFDLSDNMMKCAILRMKHTMIGDAFVEEFTDSLTDCIYEIKKVKQRSL